MLTLFLSPLMLPDLRSIFVFYIFNDIVDISKLNSLFIISMLSSVVPSMFLSELSKCQHWCMSLAIRVVHRTKSKSDTISNISNCTIRTTSDETYSQLKTTCFLTSLDKCISLPLLRVPSEMFFNNFKQLSIAKN